MDGLLSDLISLHRELITDVAIIIIQELVPEKISFADQGGERQANLVEK